MKNFRTIYIVCICLYLDNFILLSLYKVINSDRGWRNLGNYDGFNTVVNSFNNILILVLVITKLIEILKSQRGI